MARGSSTKFGLAPVVTKELPTVQVASGTGGQQPRIQQGEINKSIVSKETGVGVGDAVIRQDTSKGFWIGDSVFLSAPFRVDMNGNLVASSATITGAITATSGTVGGFDIGSDYIRDAGNTMGMASTVTGGDDVRFWAGDTYANRATADFVVTEAGAITAANINITGGSITGPGMVAVVALNLANRGWTQTCVFSVTDADTVAWSSGSFTTADGGTTYAISAGNTGNMAAKTYIYLDINVSSTVLQTTTTATTAVGVSKVLIAVAQNGTGEATFQVLSGQGGQNIDASNIVANSITANELSTSIVYAGSIVIDTSGVIRSGQTAFDTGTGWFLGNVAGTPKLSIGNSAGNKMTWDGTDIEIYTNSANAIIVDAGGDILLKQGGDINFTSVTAPGACTATLVTTGTGNVDNGTHVYKVTFVNGSGETNVGTFSNTVTVDASHKQVDLSSIPVSSSGSVTARKIYRTLAGASSGFRLLTTINDNSTTVYTDNIADSGLGAVGADARFNSTFGKIYIDGVSALTLASGNMFIGQDCGNTTLVNDGNLGIGINCMTELTTASSNTAVGFRSLELTTTGYNNVAVGGSSMGANTTGYENVSVGRNALRQNTTGYTNVAVGMNALDANTSGASNVAVGKNALRLNTTGNDNVAVGYIALDANTTGQFNIAIGSNVLSSNTTGDGNLAIGDQALRYNSTGASNISIGKESTTNCTTGTDNTCIGFGALYDLTDGQFNVVLGNSAGRALTTGDNNICIGYKAGRYAVSSNEFYLDSAARANNAAEKANSLLYGIIGADAASQKLTINGLLNQSVSKTPASAAATGTTGDICWDASYIYVCTATDTWKRVAIATW